MKKKFTLLITVTALLLGNSGKVWGQTHFEHGTKTFNSTFSVENNYGPGESGTLTPNAGLSTNMGNWATPPTAQGFDPGSGIITVGNTSNVVTHMWVNNRTINESGSISACISASGPSGCGAITWTGGTVSGTQYCSSYSWTTYAEVFTPVVPDGTGVLNNAATYTYATVATVDGRSGKTYIQPWELDQLYFMQNRWYYHKYQLDKSGSYTHSVAVSASRSDCAMGTSSISDSDSKTHQGITWQEWLNNLGGEVPGWIVLVGGSHVNVKGTNGISSGNTSANTKTYLHLPSSPYSLMIDTKFDQTSIKNHGAVDLSGTGTVANGRTAGSASTTLSSNDVLTKNAVLGIHNAFIGDNLETNTAGGTLLLGPSTTGQAQMVINTPGGSGSITQTFNPTGLVKTTAYGNTHYQNDVVSVGNYGNDGLGLDAPGMFSSTTTGTSGLQIFSHTPDAVCIDLIFKANAAWTFGISSGNLLIDSKNNLDFGTTLASDPNTFTTSAGGHTTLRGGNRVAFVNGLHTYNGSHNGDYWVNAVAASGTNYCGDGDILSMAAAPAVVKNVGGIGNLKWEAKRDINTKGTVQFDADLASQVDWIAHDRNIHTENTVDFTHSGTGRTKWEAQKNIWTEKAVKFSQTGTGDTYWHAIDNNIETSKAAAHVGPVTFEKTNANSGYTEWRAGDHIITNAKINFKNNGAGNTMWLTDRFDVTTNDWVDFLNTSSGNTEWHAYRHIETNDTVTFTNSGTGNTKWWAETGNITTNKGSENGFVTFTNSSATGANTDWQARLNIFTNNVVTFNNGPAAVTNAYIKWWAETQDIQMNDSTIFNQLGTTTGPGTELRNLSPALLPSGGSLWLWADQNIKSENNTGLTPNSPSGVNEEPLLINFAATNNAPIMLHAKNGSIILDGVTHVDRQSNGTTKTTLEAGLDIHFLDTMTLFDNSATADILLHAGRDIRTNDSTCSANYTAPVLFEVKNDAITHWVADRNVVTKDTVNFKYNATGNAVNDLNIVARGGNIKTNRWFNIDYDGEKRILFSAVSDMPAPNDFVYPYSPAGSKLLNGPDNAPRNTVNGNILFNDSMKITRNNLVAGKTDILAKYNIRTAMVDYVDQLSTGNNTTVESYLGDIFLGYSMKPDPCVHPVSDAPYSFDNNIFTYKVLNPAHNGQLQILAGYEDQANTNQNGGGNIFFTHLTKDAAAGATSSTEISIPFSNEYACESSWSNYLKLHQLGDTLTTARIQYEHAGIIGGVGACGWDANLSAYDPMDNGIFLSPAATDTTLIYHGNHGNLLVDAGTRGNIIINRGSYLNFQQNNGNSEFRTRNGNIDMRYPFNADSLQGSLLFLASSDEPNKLKTDLCGCKEEKNNVYLQDFRYYGHGTSGSIFVGADNNIKLQYGGLKNIVTPRDPFFSPNGDNGYPCGTKHHCDADTTENQARALILNFDVDTFGAPITSGGFAAVASDLIDVYKNTIYNGGQGSGLSSVPGYGTLHGESVAGYGLYIKTQANKDNWNKTDHDVNQDPDPTVGAACDDNQCTGNSYLHQVARVTFHSDARIYTENQRSYISSPVLEVYGFFDLNTHDKKGGKTAIQIQTDSLIMHDSLIIDGKLTTFSTWSGLYRDMPIFKLGHQRTTPPVAEPNCAPCYTHAKDEFKKGATTPLDTIFVTFRNGASVDRLHTLVADHAVISFLTDSFDHVQGDPTINATFYADTFKVRNHVELFRTADHTHDGHFELVSEPQMHSKEYAGIFSRHLHMEPIAPACTKFGYSQLWQLKPSLTVITTSTFGGFGWLHSDVHVEIGANLFPGYASLQKDGNCYEQMAGILKMEDLRLDKGANLKFSVGDKLSDFVQRHSCSTGTEYLIGGYADCLDVDSLSIYGEMLLEFVVRPEGLDLGTGESRCFPIIRYKSVGKENLNNLKLKKSTFTEKDHWSINGTYYLALDFDTVCNIVNVCVSTNPNPTLHRKVVIPSESGVTTNPGAGIYFVQSGNDFRFKVTYTTPEPLKVLTGRTIQGVDEEIWGWLNPNGEYEYVIHDIKQDIFLSIGPGNASPNPNPSNEEMDGVSVWSHDKNIYVRVKREDIATIYSVSGQLVKRVEVPEGDTAIPMQKGMYVVTLKDGSVHKVIIK